MYGQIETELKARLKKVGISYRDLAGELDRPYNTIVSWFNGFVKMPTRVRMQILKLIEEREGGEK